MVDLQTQYKFIKTNVDAGIEQVLNSAQFINGPAVKSFQKNLESYLGVKNVIPCANGTASELNPSLVYVSIELSEENTFCRFVCNSKRFSTSSIHPLRNISLVLSFILLFRDLLSHLRKIVYNPTVFAGSTYCV